MQSSKAPNTLRAYGHEWKVFQRWCAEFGRSALPADSKTLCLFVTWEAREEYSIETIRLGLAAIRHFHAEHGFALRVDDELREVTAGIARQQARTKDPNRRVGKDALQIETLLEICRVLRTDDPRDVRDRAIILLGFASAWRRSELCQLRTDSVTFERGEDGRRQVVLRIGYSKTDQEGKGKETAVPAGRQKFTCPVRALEAWLKVRGDQPGALFTRFFSNVVPTAKPLGGRGMCDALQRAIERVGETPEAYGVHSLRSGMITAADRKHVSLRDIMDHTGHKTYQTVLRYMKPQRSNPLAGVL